MKFDGKILVIGCGSVSQCAVPLILKLIRIPPQNVTIMDFVDNRSRVRPALERGVHYAIRKITKENYKSLLSEYVGAGDLILDLAWDIDTCALLEWCHIKGVHYLNTSIELWEPYKGLDNRHPTEFTLYARHMVMRKMIRAWKKQRGATAVVDHGANPGLVSHLTKQALQEIARLILDKKPKDLRAQDLKQALKINDFAKLAMLEGVKTIHVSERDTQITRQPKEVNEFVNTWSIAGLYEEGVAPSELGWGTHERKAPKGAMFHKNGPKNQICLTSKGMSTWVRSWVPCGEIIGMVIRHGEAFSISDRLTVWENDKAIYRPTVYYAYCPCDAAINSLHELEMRQYVLQDQKRIMNDEITSGRDELGCLLMGHDFKSWWIGSLLDIKEARKLVPHQNATTLQVAVSAVAAAMWILENPDHGVCVPDDLPHEPILKIVKPFLGPFVSKPVDWTPLQNRQNLSIDYGCKLPEEDAVWQFSTFLISPLTEFEDVEADSHEKVRVYTQ